MSSGQTLCFFIVPLHWGVSSNNWKGIWEKKLTFDHGYVHAVKERTCPRPPQLRRGLYEKVRDACCLTWG